MLDKGIIDVLGGMEQDDIDFSMLLKTAPSLELFVSRIFLLIFSDLS